MTEGQKEWIMARDRMISAIRQLGFHEALGEQLAKMLGSPKAMERMTAYLQYVKPRSDELIVDEALAIVSDVERWKNKKAAEEANARYNEILYYGLGTEEEE